MLNFFQRLTSLADAIDEEAIAQSSRPTSTDRDAAAMTRPLKQQFGRDSLRQPLTSFTSKACGPSQPIEPTGIFTTGSPLSKPSGKAKKKAKPSGQLGERRLRRKLSFTKSVIGILLLVLLCLTTVCVVLIWKRVIRERLNLKKVCLLGVFLGLGLIILFPCFRDPCV